MRAWIWNRAGAITLTLLAACGSERSPSAAAEGAALNGEDVTAICTAVITRQRECSETYVPALVDLRIRLDRPPGIAERGAGNGRAGLIAAAIEEWRADSTDEAIAGICNAVRGTARAADFQLVQAEDCLSQDSCQAFVSCLEPVLEHFLR